MKFCPKCGNSNVEGMKFCPECGNKLLAKPTTESTTESFNDSMNQRTENNFQNKTTNSGYIDNTIEKMSNGIQNTLTSFKTTKKIGPVQIDEVNRLFRINGTIAVNGKKSSIMGATFKGMMAVGTMGMSVAAEKALGLGKKKIGSKDWYEFSDLVSYDLLEDDSIVTSGGVGQALIGGALFGGFGAVAGGITGKRTQKKKVDSIYIKVTLNDFNNPCVMIPLITKSIKTNSKEYKNAFNDAHQILAIFDVITHNQ